MKLTKISASLVRSLILARKKDSHKGDYGHVLVVAGSRNMTGAAVLCANAALRSGAGLVTVVVVKSAQEAVSKRLFPEAMVLPLAENIDGTFTAGAAGKILEFAAKMKVSGIALGPGLGRGKNITAFVKNIISNAPVPIILDADGLNAIRPRDLKFTSTKIVVTPHPAELSRLTGVKTADIQSGRVAAAQNFARKYNVVCVLKGSGTVVTDGKRVFVNTTGNPGMAKGGSGDVLTGVIAALRTQVMDKGLFNAATAGVYVHGLAGDIAARVNSEVSMLPQDIISALPAAFRRVN